MRPWLFALYLRSYGPEPAALPEPTTASHVQPLLLYAAIAGTFVLDFLTGERTTVVDALGQTWRTGDIYEASVLTTIYGMGFFTVLAALSLARRNAAAVSPTDASLDLSAGSAARRLSPELFPPPASKT